LDQLAAHHEQIIRLDAREADHFAALTTQLTDLADLATQQLDDDGRYQPDPAPPWWRLALADRAEPLARLRAWVEQVYRPGYGHLAATLAPCWEAHDLCLYALDIAAALWSVLYLQPERTPGLLSAQAEYQARILPALAAQLMTETTRCAHHPAPRPRSGARHDR
jgi:hypothetical protein